MKGLKWSAAIGLLLSLTGCGGGSSSGSGTSSGTTSGTTSFTPLTITTPNLLPGTLENVPYSATLAVEGGSAPYHWSIAPVTPNTLFVDGLTIDANTGVLSGTPTFHDTAGFTATVTDSGARQATKGFSLDVSVPLQAGPAEAFSGSQYADIGYGDSLFPLATGGVQPITYTLGNNCLPPGLRYDPAYQRIVGSPIAVGTFGCTVTIQDSYRPPEVVTSQLSVRVSALPLSATITTPQSVLLNRPSKVRIVASGGMKPYTFSLAAGSTLPQGFGPIDSGNGEISGTPTSLTSQTISVNVSDSSSPPQTASVSFDLFVTNPKGRNDSIASATPLDNGYFQASISPFADPPENSSPTPDSDYYKIVSVSASTVHVATQTNHWLLDTVLELVDGNNNRYTTCNQPGIVNTSFSSLCLNDDNGAGDTDSTLDFQVPGAPSTPTTFYIHVLDWRGDARPDMLYSLIVNGVVDPLTVQTVQLSPAARGLSYSQPLNSANAVGIVSWSLASGSLPPGLGLDGSGAINGVATTDGTYSFALKATDSSNPPQTATVQESIKVVEPITIVSSGTFPNACRNQPYSFPVQTSGGSPPFLWGFNSANWMAISLDQSTGTFRGTSDVTGTFVGTVYLTDATGHTVSQQVSLTVAQCP